MTNKHDQSFQGKGKHEVWWNEKENIIITKIDGDYDEQDGKKNVEKMIELKEKK